MFPKLSIITITIIAVVVIVSLYVFQLPSETNDEVGADFPLLKNTEQTNEAGLENILENKEQRNEAVPKNTEQINKTAPSFSNNGISKEILEQNSKCVRLVVPFIQQQFFDCLNFFSWWSFRLFPPCASNKTCIHVHAMLDSPFISTVNETMNEIQMKIDLALQKMTTLYKCTPQTTFSIFEGGNTSYSTGSYVALKQLIIETHSLGYKSMALLEPDAYPMKAGWMDKIFDLAFEDQFFLIKGTAFTLGDSNSLAYGHINGNCIWNTENISTLSRTFEFLDSATHFMESRKTGYDIILYHLFIKSHEEAQRKNGVADDKMQELHMLVNDLHLKRIWSRGYIDVPYVKNFHPSQRPKCKDLRNEKKRKELKRLFKDSFFLHCRNQHQV